MENFVTKLFITFLIIYIYFIQATSWSVNTKIDLTFAIVDENRFEIDSFYNNTGDRSYYNGHYYTDKAPGVSFLASPFYITWKFIYNHFRQNSFSPQKIEYKINKIINTTITSKANFNGTQTYEPINPGVLYLGSISILTIAISSLSSALTVILVYKISKYFLKKHIQRILITIAYGLGTLAFIYGTVLFTHTLATLLIFISFYLLFLFKIKRMGKNVVLLSGLLAGFAIVVDYPVFLIALLLFVYTLTFKYFRLSLLFLSFTIVGCLPLLLYNFSILGNPFKLVYSFTDPSIRTDVGKFMGFASLPNPFIIYRHLFDTYRGLLFFHPFLILSVIGFYWMFKKYKQETLLIALAFIGLLITFSMRDINFFDFGSSFGARNYLPIIPFLMLPLMFSLRKINFTVFKILLIISIFVNIIGLQNWEWVIGEEKSVYIAEVYRNKINSFEILANPIKDYYLPLFLANGPRARIVENIFDGKEVFEIRHEFSSFNKHPFITLIPLILILIVIWFKEFSFQEILNVLINNPEIIFVPLILVLIQIILYR
jgi:4-amino-4-deoxy-L-arabinose transferase-like glycosyltransferase